MDRKIIQVLSIGLFLTLLVWGTYTLLYYLGVPIHTGVLYGVNASNSLNEICDPEGFICRGFHALFPIIQHTITRAPFVLWYASVCIVLYLATLGWGFVKRNHFGLSMTMKPWKIVVMFAASMWLLFTCLSFIQSSNLPISTIVEPHPEVYQGAGDEALETLQRNYDSLKERGCLTRIGVFGGVAEASEISMRCIQASFFTRVLPPFVVVLFLLAQCLIAGRAILRKLFKFHSDILLTETIVSLCTGACVWVALLWLGAVLHMYTVLFGWGLVVAVPLLCFRDTTYWLKRFLRTEWEISERWLNIRVILFWILVSYLAFNFINIVRPFPIGWDDLGSYLNRPRLLVSYGEFVFSMAPFQWEYMTSLGFLLFGYNAVFGATTALAINWAQGLLAVLTVYLFARTFLGRGHGLLSAILYYTLPVVGHFSFADMKIDNAVFTMGAMAMFAIFSALFLSREDRKMQYTWIALSAFLAAFAFSFKATAIMVFMAIGAMLVGLTIHWSAIIASVFFAIVIFIQQGALQLPQLLERLDYSDDVSSGTFMVMSFLIGLAVLIFALWKSTNNMRCALVKVGILVGVFIATLFPWIEHNNIRHGNIIPRLELRAPNTFTPRFDMFGIDEEATYSLPPELAVDQQHPLCNPSGAREELDRYWGFGKGWNHYLTLPFRSVMNLDSAGYYITTQPALLLFPLLLLLPFFWRKEGKWLRWLWLTTVLLVVQWIFLANGILWYGIGMFLGLVICLEVLIAKAPDIISRTLTVLFVVMSLLICMGMRLWQFETQRNIFEYPLGKISAESIRERTIPWYDDITDAVLNRNENMPDRPMLYRIGTFMPYFVPRNLEIIGISDHQLDYFNCLHQDRDNIKTVQRLKALGFNSIIFDTNTATIEKNPAGSLHQKVKTFVDFINHPDSNLDVVIYDPSAGISYILIP